MSLDVWRKQRHTDRLCRGSVLTRRIVHRVQAFRDLSFFDRGDIEHTVDSILYFNAPRNERSKNTHCYFPKFALGRD